MTMKSQRPYCNQVTQLNSMRLRVTQPIRSFDSTRLLRHRLPAIRSAGNAWPSPGRLSFGQGPYQGVCRGNAIVPPHRGLAWSCPRRSAALVRGLAPCRQPSVCEPRLGSPLAQHGSLVQTCTTLLFWITQCNSQHAVHRIFVLESPVQLATRPCTFKASIA